MYKKYSTQFNIILFIIVLVFFPISKIYAGNEEQAIKLFEDKQYNDALILFKELNASSPDDARFSYYYGVCLVETNRFGERAKELLLKSANSAAPANINFFIGKNFHAINQFDLAMAYYTLFKSNAKSKEVKASGVKELMELCPKRINPFEQLMQATIDEVPAPETNSVEQQVADSVEQPTVNSEDQTIEEPQNETIEASAQPEPVEVDSIPEALRDSIINFNINAEILYRKIEQFRTNEGQKFFIEGFYSMSELNKLIGKVRELRTDYQNAETREKKEQIAQEVLSLELQIPEIKSNSDIKFSNARDIEILFWQEAQEKEVFKLKAENDSIDSLKTLISTSEVIPEPIVENTDTTEIKTEEQLPEIKPTQTDTTTSNSILYKIQIGVYKTELPAAAKALYKKISTLRRIDKYTDEKGVTVYSIGEVTSFKDAVKLQEQIRNESIKDAFIIIFKDGKKLPWTEAKAYMK